MFGKLFQKTRTLGRDSSQQDASHRVSSNRFCIICCNEVISAFERDIISGRVYCAKHKFDNTLFCSCCHTHQVGNERFIDYINGWEFCRDCHGTAIMDREKLMPIVKKVQKFYKELNMKVDEDIPAFLVDKHEFQKHSTGTSITGFYQGYKVITKEKTHQLTQLQVRALIVFNGIPEVLVGEILAYEMMYLWLRPQRLERQILLGICQVMIYMWLHWLACAIDDSLYESNEQVKFVRKLIEARKFEMEVKRGIHGDEFRAAKKAVDKFGFQETLDYIAKTKSLPW